MMRAKFDRGLGIPGQLTFGEKIKERNRLTRGNDEREDKKTIAEGKRRRGGKEERAGEDGEKEG